MPIINATSLYCELIFLAGSEGSKTFTKPHIRLGRQPDNDFVTPNAGTSRIHAEIIWEEGVWKIRNLNPANKITVNKQDIQQEAELHHFDEIGLGRHSQTLIRFLAFPHRADIPDPTMDATAHLSQSSLGAALLGEEKNDGKLRDSLRNSQDSAWQLVGIILTAVSAIVTSYALSPTMFVPGIITILIGMVLCISVVILPRPVKRALELETLIILRLRSTKNAWKFSHFSIIKHAAKDKGGNEHTETCLTRHPTSEQNLF